MKRRKWRIFRLSIKKKLLQRAFYVTKGQLPYILPVLGQQFQQEPDLQVVGLRNIMTAPSTDSTVRYRERILIDKTFEKRWWLRNGTSINR